MITVLLIICAIVFIISLLYFTDTAYTKHDCKKYQELIDHAVNELFPPSSIQTPVITAVQTPAVNTYTPTPNLYAHAQPIRPRPTSPMIRSTKRPSARWSQTYARTSINAR